MLQVCLRALLEEFPVLRSWIDDDDARLHSIGTLFAVCQTLEHCSLPQDASDALVLMRDGLLGVAQAALLMAHRTGMDVSEPQVSLAETPSERGKSGRYLPPLEVLRSVLSEALAWHLSLGQGLPRKQAELCEQITAHRLYRVRNNPSGGMSDKTLSRFLGEHGLRYEDELARAYPEALTRLRVLRARGQLKQTAADSA
jgi:hypothetical protein